MESNNNNNNNNNAAKMDQHISGSTTATQVPHTVRETKTDPVVNDQLIAASNTVLFPSSYRKWVAACDTSPDLTRRHLTAGGGNNNSLLSRAFSIKDACDSKEEQLKVRLMVNLLSMVNYTVTHLHPSPQPRGCHVPSVTTQSSVANLRDEASPSSAILIPPTPQLDLLNQSQSMSQFTTAVNNHHRQRTVSQLGAFPSAEVPVIEPTLKHSYQPQHQYFQPNTSSPNPVYSPYHTTAAGECTNARDYRGDFIEALLFDCRRGNMVGELDKLLTYLTEEYFIPVKLQAPNCGNARDYQPSSKRRKVATSTRQGATLKKSGPAPSSTSDFQLLFDQLLADNPLTSGSAKKYTPSAVGNSGASEKERLVLDEDENPLNPLDHHIQDIHNTVSLIKYHIRAVESLETRRMECVTQALKHNLLFTLVPQQTEDQSNNASGLTESTTITTPPPTTTTTTQQPRPKTKPRYTHREQSDLGAMDSFAQVLRVKAQFQLEFMTLYYMNRCEDTYLNLKFLILGIIAREPVIANQISLLSNSAKYRNFPLYLKHLFDELENETFNTHNAVALIKRLVVRASAFYQNAIVHASVRRAFYSHPNYVKRPLA